MHFNISQAVSHCRLPGFTMRVPFFPALGKDTRQPCLLSVHETRLIPGFQISGSPFEVIKVNAGKPVILP